MIQESKLELDFVMGLSTANTKRKTAFFLKDDNILAPAGRQLFLFRSHIFESHGLENGIKCEDQHAIKMSSECQEWLRKHPRVTIDEGHSSQQKTFFVFNLKEPGPLDEEDLPIEGVNKAMRDLVQDNTLKHPVIFYLNCSKEKSEWEENRNALRQEGLVRGDSSYLIEDSKKWKQKKQAFTLDPNSLKLQMWEFRDFKNCFFENISLFSHQKEYHLIALTSERPQSLISFNFSKMKTTGVNTLTKNNIYDKIAVNPEDKYLVIATGSTHKKIKLHRINDKMKGDEFTVKSSIKHEGLSYPQWLSANCFLVTSNEGFGIFLFCLNKKLKIELVQRIEHFEGMCQNDLYQINFVQNFSQGFVCGLNDGSGLLFLDDKMKLVRYKMNRNSDQKDRFLPVSRVQFSESKSKTIAIDFIQGEDKFLQISDDNSLCIIPSGELIAKDNFNINLISDFSLKIKSLQKKGHSLTRKKGKIDNVDIASFKPLMLLISMSSNSLQIVDFEKKKLVYCNQFPNEGVHQKSLRCGAIHPSGLYCLLGFESKLELYSVTYSCIK
jgi:hypothetical protein